MPLSIWTRDQVPELALRGMEALGQGAAGAGAAIGSGIEKRLDESKRLNTAGKAAKTFLDALIDASDDDDTNKSMRKEANKGLSSTDAIAAMTGKLQAQGYATAQAHFKEVMLRLTGQEAQNKNLAKAPAFFQEAASYGTAPGDVPFDATPAEFERRTAPLDVRALLEAAGKTGYNPGNQVDDLLRALKQSSPGMGPEVLKALGMVPSGGMVNPNLTASITYGMPPPPVAPAVIPDNLKPTTVHVDEKGKASTTYSTVPDKRAALTDAQANALQYSERMKFNNSIIDHIEAQGFSPATVSGTVQGALPNFMAGEMSQQYHAAARNWISAVLRKESGAAISKSEESGALNQYFPKLGDAPSVIQQKADLRKLAEENMRRAIGNIDDPAKPKVEPILEAPKEPGKRSKDKVYQTPRGPMKWTGTGWVAP
jgi:hypothetical protein